MIEANEVWMLRSTALELLALLEPTALAQHAHAVVSMLEDSHECVRLVALDTLNELEPTTLVQHGNVVRGSRCGPLVHPCIVCVVLPACC